MGRANGAGAAGGAQRAGNGAAVSSSPPTTPLLIQVPLLEENMDSAAADRSSM
jgi:hypothetical protein